MAKADPKVVKPLRDYLRKMDLVSVQPVKRTDGTTADVYYDIKKAYGDPKALRELGMFLGGLIPEEADETICVAGFGHGGIPLAVAVGMAYQKPITLVRSELKPHGLQKLIDGYLPKTGDRVAIVDDVVISGRSLHNSISMLRENTGADVIGCYVVLKDCGFDKDEINGVPLEYLFEPADLIK